MLNSMEAVFFLNIKFSEFIAKNMINEIYVKIIVKVNVRIFLLKYHISLHFVSFSFDIYLLMF